MNPLSATLKLSSASNSYFNNEGAGDLLIYPTSSNQKILIGNKASQHALLQLHDTTANVGGTINAANVSTNLVQATGIHLSTYDPSQSNVLQLVAPMYVGGGGGQDSGAAVAASNQAFGVAQLQRDADTGAVQSVVLKAPLLPDADETLDLGSSNRRFRSLYVSGNTIYVGNSVLGADSNGSIRIGNVDPQVSARLVIDEIQIGGPGASNATIMRTDDATGQLTVLRASPTGSNDGSPSATPIGAFVTHDSNGWVALGRSQAEAMLDVAGDVLVRGSVSLSNATGTVAVSSSGSVLNLPAVGVQGAATFASNVTVLGQLAVHDVQYNYSNVTVFTSEEIRSNLLVRGQATFSNGLSVAEGSLFAGSNARVNGDLDVGGASSAGAVTLRVSNSNSGSAALVRHTLTNDGPLGGVIMRNSSTRTQDGGADAMTVRNDGGLLRLAASNASATNMLGIFVTPSNNFVGIGTSNPTVSLHVTGQILATDDIVAFSDCNFKRDIEPIRDALGKLQHIGGYTYSFTDDVETRRRAGVLAQEVRAVLPEVVYESSPDGRLQVAYGNLVALLISGMNELRTEVDHVKRTIAGFYP
jgi:hypothetical protein